MQSPSTVQPDLHEVALEQVRKPAHDAVGAWHVVLVPLHTATVLGLTHEQMVPAVDGVQLPEPLQPPPTQLATLATHAPCGSPPDGTLVQVPSEPATLHALHPLHELAATLQQ
jgi:hypothetical protein